MNLIYLLGLKFELFLFGLFYSYFHSGSNIKCNLCGNTFSKFRPEGFKYSILKTHKVIGAGYRRNAKCPKCGALDRERLVYCFLNKYELLQNHVKLLHIAPELSLQKALKAKVDYLSADLNSPLADYKVNLLSLPFDLEQFDAIICNHVLEHIENDRQAILELYRTLRIGGWGIFQVPISREINKTIENENANTKRDRIKNFGQKDHCRIYGSDYLDRLKSVGFKVDEIYLENQLIDSHALNKNECIFLCRK